MAQQFETVSSRYGAPMGRRADGFLETDVARECGGDIRAEIHTQREALKTNRQQFRAVAMELRNSATLAPAICDAVKSKLQSLMADRAQAMARIVELSV